MNLDGLAPRCGCGVIINDKGRVRCAACESAQPFSDLIAEHRQNEVDFDLLYNGAACRATRAFFTVKIPNVGCDIPRDAAAALAEMLVCDLLLAGWTPPDAATLRSEHEWAK